MSKAWLWVLLTTIALFFAAALIAPTRAQTRPETPQTSTIAEKTAGAQRLAGYFNLYWDAKQGKLWLEIDKWGSEFLYQSGLPAGIGSNDIGLDRGQLGATRIVRFERSGPKVLLIQENLEYRAVSNDPDERRAVHDSFAESALWGFKVEAEEKDHALVDATDFFLRDAHGIPAALHRTKQGSYHLDASRCVIYLPQTKNFPLNTEVEATLTFAGEEPGRWVRDVTPSPESITVREHHSFVQLPPAGYKARAYDPRSSFFGIAYMDYATPISEPVMKRFIARHRLEKKDPKAAASEAVQPIVYYLDRGAPEPIRSALLEGARWWNQAFEAAGYKSAFRVEMMPEGADLMDLRYNVIQWVHRATRGCAGDGAGAAAATGGPRSGAHAGTDAQLFSEHGQPFFGDGLSTAVRKAWRRWRAGFVRSVYDGNRRMGQSIHRVWLSGFCSGDERRSSAEQNHPRRVRQGVAILDGSGRASGGIFQQSGTPLGFGDECS